MKKQCSLTLVGFTVGVLVTLFVILIALPTLSSIHNIAASSICRTNLKGLGTAMMVYGNDYDDNYPQLPGNGMWSQNLGFPYFLKEPNFNGPQSDTPRTITSSWYLLVREADVHPKSLVCPYSTQTVFNGESPESSDLTQLWDFGYDPHQNVSYVYHNPYGRFPADGTRSAAFAVAADMNPWFNNGNFIIRGKNLLPPQIINLSDENTWKYGNSFHSKSNDNTGHGQKVLWADGHTSYEKQPNVGVKYDNIYTYWSTEENPTEQDKQGGTAPTNRSAENDAKSKDDSFLAI